MKTYIAGALTHHEGQKEIYELLGKLCQDKGINTYVPHLAGTDPIKNPEVTPQTVWEIDEKQVSEADFIIAYVGQPSLGVGAELEIARLGKTDIILWWYEDEKVSRMALGNPGVVEKIVVKNQEELLNKLVNFLEKNYGR